MYRLSDSDHPRIRGEHSGVSWIVKNGTGSSPHTRGAPGFDSFWRRVRGIIPAYAGSTASGRAWRRRSGDHPRIRGEHVTTFSAIDSPPGSSPHTRGALELHAARRKHLHGSSPHTRGARGRVHRHRRPVRIIPAYAGSTMSVPTSRKLMEDHPRIRGEHPPQRLQAHETGGSSPHTRGALVVFSLDPHFRMDHPRIRGEHRGGASGTDDIPGSSPHTRGAHRRRRGRSAAMRIIPAYAGSTPPCYWRARSGQDHPRIRGEHQIHLNSTGDIRGSSPHTRGAHPRRGGSPAPGWIIPAYAGSTILPSAMWAMATGSSPHTRGARRSAGACCRAWRIIPAYAGSTLRGDHPLQRSRDHPRIRGEHL